MIVQQSIALGAVGWRVGLMLILLIKDFFPRRILLGPINAVALASGEEPDET
ncbi:hypothetical protein [Rhizobium terricola]|uniref:hypothetical protein n=1 Tax=Rhizobium terricola TaxID=2728849 RepID=UPI0028F448E2|nr:hypothetical protein [Rhizobium terricola]